MDWILNYKEMLGSKIMAPSIFYYTDTMKNLKTLIKEYLAFDQYQKRLDSKTLRAYNTDLQQFSQQYPYANVEKITPNMLEHYISYLHQKYKPKTAKRKIASLKAFFHYLEYKEKIERNPFNKLQIKFREPIILPKTIPLHTVETFLSTLYHQLKHAKTSYQKRNALRDIAVIISLSINPEIFFAIKPYDE